MKKLQKKKKNNKRKYPYCLKFTNKIVKMQPKKSPKSTKNTNYKKTKKKRNINTEYFKIL